MKHHLGCITMVTGGLEGLCDCGGWLGELQPMPAKESASIYLWAVMFNDYEGTYLVSMWTMESDARATMEKLSAANTPMRNGKRQEFPGYEVERIKLNTDTYDEDNYT